MHAPKLVWSYGQECECKKEEGAGAKKVSKFKVMVTKATMILPHLCCSSAVYLSALLSSDVLIYTCSVAE